MPPPESPPQSNAGQSTTQNTEPYYSNEDVAILHDIVVFAEALLPTLPERERLPTFALFSAYYDILPRIGLNADYDSRYARVLFKIGGLRHQGSLYEKFEEILSRMGIDIEIDAVDEDYDTSSSLENSHNDAAVPPAYNTTAQEGAQDLPERPRRNSESTKWDLATEARTPNRRNSFSAASKLNQDTDRIPDFLQKSSRAHPSPTKETATRNQEEENFASNARARINRQVERPQRERGRSLSTHGSLHIRRQSTSIAPSQQVFQHGSFLGSENPPGAASEATAITSYGEEIDGRRSAKSYNGFAFNQPSPGLLEIKASLILQHHVSFLAKQHMEIWKEKALQLREDSHGLELIALNHDKKALLRSALVDWQSRLEAKRMTRETEGFFTHLESRATKARNLYLMHIAFTHWSACATEQVQRTALARRHIIRTRVFNAWREITAVNELKVRRQVLKKFFSIWEHANTTRETHTNTAIQRYNGNLAKRIYQGWIERYRTINATKWLNEGIKRRTLFRWIVESHNSWEERRTADEKRRLRLIRNTWSIWRAKTIEHIQQRQTAESHYISQLCRKALLRWRQVAMIIPAQTTFQASADKRLLRGAFATWLHRFQQEKQATQFDRMKILREAWTVWQYQNRVKVVAARSDARIISQSIYKWVVAARLLGMRRRVEGRVKREILGGWSSQSEATNARRMDQEHEAQSMTVYKDKISVLSSWRSRLEQYQNLEHGASDFFRPRILQEKLTCWKERAQHLQQLHRWSGDARFYFIASKTLKQWKSSTETAKREKRKTAYTNVRRMKKLNLVGGVIRNWQRQTREVLDLKNQAEQVSYNRTIVLGMEILDRWRGHTADIFDMEASCGETVLRKYFTIWRTQSNTLRELENEAAIAYEERQQGRVIKNWSLRALKIRAQSNYALDIHEKNAKRAFRKILQYWHQKAAEKRPFTRFDPMQLAATARAAAWSDAGDDVQSNDWAKGLDEPPTVAPVPGYLSTPSKRTERVKSIATRFSTTPRMPLPTPLERQFRAQYSGGGLPSFRRPFGRSTLGLGGGFADMSEKHTNDDRE